MRRVVVSTGGLITLRCSPGLVLEWCGRLWCRQVVWSRSDAHLGLYGSDAAGWEVDGWSDHAQMLTWACTGVMRRVVVSTGGLITLRCSPGLVWEWCGGCCLDRWSDHALMLTGACIGVMRQVVVSTGGLITLRCSPRLVMEWCGGLWCRRVVWSHSDAHLGLYWSDAAGCGVDRWSDHAQMLTWACIGVMRQVGVSTGGLITLWCSPGLVLEWCGGLGCRRVVWSRSDAHLGLYWSDAAGLGVDGWSDHALMLT